jgi:hypothetical protein
LLPIRRKLGKGIPLLFPQKQGLLLRQRRRGKVSVSIQSLKHGCTSGSRPRYSRPLRELCINSSSNSISCTCANSSEYKASSGIRHTFGLGKISQMRNGPRIWPNTGVTTEFDSCFYCNRRLANNAGQSLTLGTSYLLISHSRLIWRMAKDLFGRHQCSDTMKTRAKPRTSSYFDIWT